MLLVTSILIISAAYNMFDKSFTILNLHKKSALSASARLRGVRSGRRIGTTLCIVLSGVGGGRVKRIEFRVFSYLEQNTIILSMGYKNYIYPYKL